MQMPQTVWLCDKPLVLFHTVQRDKGQQNGDGPDLFLMLGILAVVPVPADLQTAGTAEHDENDADAAGQRHDPLGMCEWFSDQENRKAWHAEKIIYIKGEGVFCGRDPMERNPGKRKKTPCFSKGIIEKRDEI